MGNNKSITNTIPSDSSIKRKDYHVTKTDSGWQGKIAGGKRASVTGVTKAEVVKETTRLAKNQSNASVKIHKSDGMIQEERTYGKDPFPPKG